jgi:hypothetical protein
MDDAVMVKALDGTVFIGSYVVLAIPPHAHVSSDIKYREPTDLGIYAQNWRVL